MKEVTPGTARSKLLPQLSDLIDKLGVHWIEPSRLHKAIGKDPLELGAYFPFHDLLYATGNQFLDINFVFLHELTHWTGHMSRLDRHLYAEVLRTNTLPTPAMMHQEEATAEFGAYMLAVHYGLDEVKAKNWLESYLKECFLADWTKAEQDAKAAMQYILEKSTDCSLCLKCGEECQGRCYE